MGLLFSRFRRKKTTIQILEELEKKMRSIEQYGYSTEQQKRRVVGTLVVFSIGLYVMAIVCFYFFFRWTSWKDILIYSTPLFIFPFVVAMLKIALNKYYERKIIKNKTKLIDLRGEKKKILEDVMDKETYKNAKQILDKYGDPEKDISASKPLLAVSNTSVVATPVQLRQRQGGSVANISAYSSPNLSLQRSPQPSMSGVSTFSKDITALSKVQLPRPILSTGGAFDRLVDYLVGDGPGNRFALICSKCMGHNGMALPEEFEYLSYNCAYCRAFNPARKQKPIAPPLMSTPIKTPISTREHNMHSGSDSDHSIDDKKNDLDSDTDVSLTQDDKEKKEEDCKDVENSEDKIVENGDDNVNDDEIKEEQSTDYNKTD